MRKIKSVGVLSCAKIAGALYGCMGLLVVPVAILGGLASLFIPQGKGALGGIGFIVMGIAAPFLYGALGFLFGALSAWLYNIMARWLGGIQIEIEESPKDLAPSSNQLGIV
jgi:hypothetical protein